MNSPRVNLQECPKDGQLQLILISALIIVITDLVLLPSVALSATLAAVVSSRNASDVVTGAHKFLQQHPITCAET